MFSSARHAASLRLPVWFTVLAGIPLAALGWLGWRLLVQERALEQQRQRERVEDAASVLANDLDRALARWEDLLPAVASGGAVSLPPGVTALAFDDRGVQRQIGVPLPYYPAVPASAGAASAQFIDAETLEFSRNDLEGAAAAYRRFATATDARVRAEALIRLARTLRKEQQLREALSVYEALDALDETPAAGTPAGLLSRRERIALHTQMHQADAAARESRILADTLWSGRYRIDRATFAFYLESAARIEPPAGRRALAHAVDEVWSLSQQQAAGRTSAVMGAEAAVAVWHRTGGLTTAVVGGVDHILASSGVSRRRDVVVWLEDPTGRAVWGGARGDRAASVRTVRETGLPWTLHVASADAGAMDPLDRRRQNILIAGFALMALVVAAASGAVFRSVNRELGTARLQSDFVATVSHEFRTPLTAMRHLTEILEEGHAPADRVPQYYRALARETRRLQALVEGLLDFGRMESGRRTYQMEPANAADIARRVVEEFEGSPAIRRIEWTMTDEDNARHEGTIRADRDALALALRNLVDNALKYSPESAPVRVSVHADAASTSIAVADRGPGIPGRERRAIFRKFVRGTAAHALSIKGTGIGLAIAERIVRAHGGRLQLESEPGRGSCFTIVLPAARRA
jgi:two-component system phosphate regulon sensor histidine kinase PhoR